MHKTLLKLFPDYQENDWFLQDDSNGNGPYIKQWNRPEPQPTRAEIEAAEALPDPVIVPQSVSMRQGREALIRRGYIATVDAHIAGMAGVEGEIARNEWDKSQVIERNRPLTLQMGQLLGLDAAGLDELFVFAATL